MAMSDTEYQRVVDAMKRQRSGEPEPGSMDGWSFAGKALSDLARRARKMNAWYAVNRIGAFSNDATISRRGYDLGNRYDALPLDQVTDESMALIERLRDTLKDTDFPAAVYTKALDRIEEAVCALEQGQ